MSFANPRRRTAARSPGKDKDNESGLALKTTMTLRKGATFHSPTSPASSNLEDTFNPPLLSRSQTRLDDVIDANRRRIALTLSDIDEALSRTENLSLSPKPEKKNLRDTSLPVPQSFLNLPVVDSTMAHPEPERPVLRPRSVRRSKQRMSDSGLGSSIATTIEKCEAAQTARKNGINTPKTAVALTGSGGSSTKGSLPSLSQKAFNRIHEHTLRPLLEKPTLKDFKSIVLDIPGRIRSKEIICLRDLEKTLFFMAPVSRLLTDDGVWSYTHQRLLLKGTAKSATLYLDFCLTSIRCIQATVEYLTDRDQVRPGDRPYTNGYFIDLKEQIYQYGRQLAAAREKGSSGDADVDKYVPRFVPLDHPANNYPREDEIRLYGGIAENGRPAELIRVRKDGSAISIATGKPVDLSENPVTFKRSLSEQREDEEEIMRSMARRKKNATAEELAPKKCREPGCKKEFKRPCDLTKHEKTHSRPWKCPIPTCKYHEFGWPTEKEMDRHVNDKHSDAPAKFECLFKPCPYKSKRESNCKQHMEKTHGWTYVRTKTNGRKHSGKPASSAQQTPPLGNTSTPSSTPTYSVPTPPQDQDAMTFPTYQADSDWFATYGIQPATLDGMDLTLEHTSPSSATSYEQYPPYQNGSTFILNDEDLYAAHVQLPVQLQVPEQLYNKIMPQQPPSYRDVQRRPPPQLQVPAHFSPSGQENAMLFTPNSLREVDEGFDEAYIGDGSDFPLFPATSAHKDNKFQQPLFAEVPSADVGFSQASQADLFDQVDWTNLDL
ncbi:Zinc finger transcription factor ace1 [Metarhizium album ARSEF 1941]|uniref:Zinc finger transcription factor ace1 n=1 Tax=Metarhizium album (strain ARSEF 1941) TaxID=1081103 RepID=A0A0B2X0Y0_METAS|nr:Zinc finger transcription factor ace1 [Metarhizium album ARSEF 1941]KHN99968.1 Zinc finger transcription factor ace1 [Metarhizium album ARSEF 1941]